MVRRMGRDHLEDLGIDERVILKWIRRYNGWRMWTEFILLSIMIAGRLLCKWQ
jgi:hypothetical protein